MKKLQATGDAVRSALSSGKELRITNANGTDLRVRIQGRPVFVSDGVISAQDLEKGGPGTQVWLPAGEVYFAPVAGSANGKVVVDRTIFQGREIRGLELTFTVGKLTSMSAASGLEPLKALYDPSGPGRDEFGIVRPGDQL